MKSIIFSKKGWKIYIKLFQIISIIIFCICCCLWIRWFIENKKNKSIQKNLIYISNFNTIQNNNNNNSMSNINFAEILKINEDTVGWIKINNTNIDYSVVKTTNNSFYLNHSFDKTYNTAGWIFVDYKNKLDGSDENIIIYGHSRRDGSMFYTLRNTLKKEWYTNKKNHEITFYTPSKVLLYQVFSIYEIPINEIDNKTSFNVKSEFQSYINNIKKRSIYDFNVEVDSQDQILTLTTCSGDDYYRIMVHAKLIN